MGSSVWSKHNNSTTLFFIQTARTLKKCLLTGELVSWYESQNTDILNKSEHYGTGR